MVTAIRRVLDQELEANPRVLVFGEDVGPKGGVHAVTLGLQEKFGRERVFDTQPQRGRHRRPRGRHGARRADAGAGNPVPQICRAGDRADPRLRDDALAHQQPLRRADGAARAGRLLQMRRPVAFDDQRGRVRAQSRLEGRGAVQRRGRGRAAAREPCAATIRCCSSSIARCSTTAWARRPWPGDDYVLPFGRAKKTREGDQITIVTWGAMVPRCEAAAEGVQRRRHRPAHAACRGTSEMVLDSVRRTRRCLIVHEDLRTGGFGAEIAAVVADEAFLDLDAPVARVTMPDIPSPHHPKLMEWALPIAGEHPRRDRAAGGVLRLDRGPRSRRAGGHQGGRARLAQGGRRRGRRERSAGRARDRQGDAGSAGAGGGRAGGDRARHGCRGGAGRAAGDDRPRR